MSGIDDWMFEYIPTLPLSLDALIGLAFLLLALTGLCLWYDGDMKL
jgi:hypothetical protein